MRIYIHNLTQWLRFRLCTLLVISHRAVQRVWGQLQLSAHLWQGWWVWHLHCRLLSNAANKDWPFIQMFCICTYFLFQMKPQEKVFFKDPVKLIQSRLQHISQVCLLCAEFAPSSLATALLIAVLGCLNVRAVSQLITRQWVIQQEIVSVRVIFVIKKHCFRITLRPLVNPWAILQKLNLSYIMFNFEVSFLHRFHFFSGHRWRELQRTTSISLSNWKDVWRKSPNRFTGDFNICYCSSMALSIKPNCNAILSTSVITRQLSELKRENADLKKQLLELKRENAELKKPLSQRRVSVPKVW